MKLYYMAGACSMATYISLLEAGQKFEAIAVGRDKKTSLGGNYLDTNPKGYVPALQLDDGTLLTENVAVLSYVATLNPAAKLAPPVGTLGYFKVVEWLAYINSEVHKSFSPLFNPNTPDAAKAMSVENLKKRLGLIEERLGTQPWLTGQDFTVADAYLYVVLTWAPKLSIDLSAFPKVNALVARAGERPQVLAARKAEGI